MYQEEKTKFYISLYQPRKQGYWDIDYISGLKKREKISIKKTLWIKEAIQWNITN